MSGEEFRAACVALGWQTVGQVARGLGVSTRAEDRYRVIGPRPTAYKLMMALEENRQLKSLLKQRGTNGEYHCGDRPREERRDLRPA